MSENILLCALLGTVFAGLAWMGFSSGTVSMRGRDYYRDMNPEIFWFGITMMTIPAGVFYYNALTLLARHR